MKQEEEFYAELSEKRAEPKPFRIQKLEPPLISKDPASYHPTVIAIGPYHHGTELLIYTEIEKFMCLGSVMDLNGESKMKKVLAALGKEEKRVRNAYSEDIDMDRNTFLKMLALDSCYIISQIFASQHTVPDHDVPNPKPVEKISSAQNGNGDTDVPTPRLAKGIIGGGSNITRTKCLEPMLFCEPWCAPYVVRDLFLLENQIPFFVIEKIYETIDGEFPASVLREKTVLFVKKILQPYLKDLVPKNVYNINPKEFHHLLHLCHMYFMPLQNHKEFDYENVKGASNLMRHIIRWHRATQYEEVGIKIKGKKYDERAPHSLLDVTFGNDEIEIPFLPIYENTVSLFRNMIALEQMSPRIYGNNFTAYAIFLSQIMCMPSDVTFLVQKGIIRHNLSSDEEVSNQFANLSQNVVFDICGKYYLKTMSWEVEDRYQVCKKKSPIQVFCKQFSNLWECCKSQFTTGLFDTQYLEGFYKKMN